MPNKEILEHEYRKINLGYSRIILILAFMIFPVTVLGPPLPIVSVFGPTFHNVTQRYR